MRLDQIIGENIISWPPPNTKNVNLYLNENHYLSFKAPQNVNSFDEYISDPSKPVPFTTRNTTDIPKSYMVEDQRFAASRTDVLCIKLKF